MCCQVFTTSFRVVSQAAVLSGSYSGPRHGSTYLLRELGPILALSLIWALFVDPGVIVVGDKIYLISSRREGELSRSCTITWYRFRVPFLRFNILFPLLP